MKTTKVLNFTAPGAAYKHIARDPNGRAHLYEWTFVQAQLDEYIRQGYRLLNLSVINESSLLVLLEKDD